ncbi:hypothetical protein RSAG8_09348, partial [Rhizoctonia solani AG-8 WAC10335]
MICRAVEHVWHRLTSATRQRVQEGQSRSIYRHLEALVDADSSFHLYHADLNFDSIVCFTIGDLPYQWDIQHGTLTAPSSNQLGADPSSLVSNTSKVQLYANLEEAKAYVDLLRFDDLTTQDGSSSSSLTSSNTSTPSNVAGVPSTFPGSGLFDSPLEAGFFGSSPSQGIIDHWVDEPVKTDGDLKCPEVGCTHNARRPRALKIHLYTHYGIKPHMCTMCGISFLTEANRRRHMKNAHTCSGCGFVGPIAVIKTHKGVCTPAPSSGPIRGNADSARSSSSISPYLRF